MCKLTSLIQHRLVLVFLLLLVSTPIYALTCGARTFTLAEAYATSDAVIVGLVTGCESETGTDAWTAGGSDCTFSALEILKEGPNARDYGSLASSSPCGLSLFVGSQYLLFLDGDNNPLKYSTKLDGDRHAADLGSHYLQVLRKFKNGSVRDLSEPWLSSETKGSCSLTQMVGGHSIRFNRSPPDAATSHEQGWSREIVDGKTILRGRDDVTLELSGYVPEESAQFAQQLTVSFSEEQPAPPRNARIAVGDHSWSMSRMQMNISMRGGMQHTMVEYRIDGETAEKILAAMLKPSDIVVTATLLERLPDPTPPAPADTSDISMGMFQSSGNNVGRISPAVSADDPALQEDLARKLRRGDPPEYELKIETRSTHLADAFSAYRACYSDETSSIQ